MGSELASDCCIQNSPTCQQLLITPACPDDQDDDDDDIDHGDDNIYVDNDDSVDAWVLSCIVLHVCDFITYFKNFLL